MNEIFSFVCSLLILVPCSGFYAVIDLLKGDAVLCCLFLRNHCTDT
jgi:hypothetical protein